ncbi:MAG: hypothetical protein WCT54_04880 [Patescibacteria group bacterium]
MPPLLALVGPSGSGKSTIIKALVAKYPDQLEISRSLTTRPKRGDEDDLFYTFTTPEDIKKRLAEGRLTHYAEYAGNFYATDKLELDKLLSRKFGIAALVGDGVRSLRKAGYEVVVINIIPKDKGLTTKDKRQMTDEARKIADAERAKTGLEADFEIVNSFEEGGLEMAIQKLSEVVNTI